MEQIRKAIWRLRYLFDPIARAISDLRSRHSFDPIRKAIWRLRYSFYPIRSAISDLRSRRAFDPIRNAISDLRSRYIGRYSFGGVAVFGLSMMLSIGLVAFGIANEPVTPQGSPADVQRSVVYPTGGIPVPGPSLGPSTQGG
jgi:predicted transcriptional regulator with HTH domain